MDKYFAVIGTLNQGRTRVIGYRGMFTSMTEEDLRRTVEGKGSIDKLVDWVDLDHSLCSLGDDLHLAASLANAIDALHRLDVATNGYLMQDLLKHFFMVGWRTRRGGRTRAQKK